MTMNIEESSCNLNPMSDEEQHVIPGEMTLGPSNSQINQFYIPEHTDNS